VKSRNLKKLVFFLVKLRIRDFLRGKREKMASEIVFSDRTFFFNYFLKI